MRLLSKLLALVATTGTLVTVAAAPAHALHDCPSTTAIVCVVTDAAAIPVGTPVVPVTGFGAFGVKVATVCDTSSSNCRDVYAIVPGAYVSSTGTTLVTIHVPEVGVAIEPGPIPTPTIYYGIPPLPTVGSPAGITLVAELPVVPFAIEPGTRACIPRSPTTVGPVTVELTTSCLVRITVAV